MIFMPESGTGSEKMQKGESYREAAVRELFEESALPIAAKDFHFLGFLQFPDFKPKKSEDWSCMLFWSEVDEKTARSVPESVAEGSLHWIEKTKIIELNLWDGDREFIPYVIAKRAFTRMQLVPRRRGHS